MNFYIVLNGNKEKADIRKKIVIVLDEKMLPFTKWQRQIK